MQKFDQKWKVDRKSYADLIYCPSDGVFHVAGHVVCAPYDAVIQAKPADTRFLGVFLNLNFIS